MSVGLSLVWRAWVASALSDTKIGSREQGRLIVLCDVRVYEERCIEDT